MAMDSFPYFGTKESLLFSNELQKRGHEVSIVTSDKRQDGKESERIQEVKYLKSFVIPKVPWLITPFSQSAVADCIRDFSPDIVMAMHFTHFTTNMAIRAAYNMKVKSVLGIRGPGTSFGSSGLMFFRNLWFYAVGENSIDFAHKILFDSKASMRAYPKITKGAVVYTPVEAEQFSQQASARYPLTITYVGALTKTKGVKFLISAYLDLLKDFPDVRLQIVGDGVERPALERLARGKVTFTGYREDIPGILCQSHIFVLPSLSEGVSASLMEAGASELACVASNVGGSPEIIEDEKSGLLFTSQDSVELRDKLARLCDSFELRIRLGKAIRELVHEKFDIGPVVDSLEAELSSCP